jgi:hypothetical protein
MKHLIFLAAALIAAPAYSFDLNGVSLQEIQAGSVELPAPVPAIVPGSENALDDQFISEKAAPFYAITTSQTNICSDGKSLTKTEKQPWVDYQKKNGFSSVWNDPWHQNETATGKVNAIEVPYVVVPKKHRELLNTKADVCLVATGKCVSAKVLEIGPAFGEVSVAVMMKLGLNAHPETGRYYGNITYKFYK